MAPQSTLGTDEGPPVIGYHFEARPLAGPNNDRPYGDWAEKYTTWHPDQLQESEIRDVTQLVPQNGDEPTIAYYFEREINEDLEGKIEPFHPKKLDTKTTNVPPLTSLEDSRFEADV